MFSEFILEFREFLVREVSDENLDFYMEVEAYKKMKPMKQAKTAIIIYNKYLKVDADREASEVIYLHLCFSRSYQGLFMDFTKICFVCRK